MGILSTYSTQLLQNLIFLSSTTYILSLNWPKNLCISDAVFIKVHLVLEIRLEIMLLSRKYYTITLSFIQYSPTHGKGIFWQIMKNVFSTNLPLLYKWDKASNSRPNIICGRQPLKHLKGYGLLRQTISLQTF